LRHYAISLILSSALILILIGAKLKGSVFLSNTSLQYLIGYFLAYGICTMSWIISYKKQLNSRLLKRRGIAYGMITMSFHLAFCELLALGLQTQREIQEGWIISGILGIFVGMWVFRLVYRNCY
jgi:hypothetical protein